ncbi:hypothetical protein C8N35_101340 [Breoghania corrubedonensis]|uniref:Sporulation related protein n=1 Tax=Breoghania corrubedonensis TaxID=665038 RepID=A0A2T5VEY0_9HYPH|nr:hypothetical protein [Breoghania corrubedonensis]PTW62300.1 hypothetical protein C8N35_101340 [Breoghania corrubedonensis]
MKSKLFLVGSAVLIGLMSTQADAKLKGKPQSLKIEQHQLPFAIKVGVQSNNYVSPGNTYTFVVRTEGACKKGHRISDVQAMVGVPSGPLMEYASYEGLPEIFSLNGKDQRTFKHIASKAVPMSAVYLAGFKSPQAFCEHKRAKLKADGWSNAAILDRDWTYKINNKVSVVMGCRRKANKHPKPWEIGRKLAKTSLPVQVVCLAR